MQLGCTKKLLDYLGKKGGPADTDIEPLLSWSAHLITLNHRHAVVAANDSSRYGFVPVSYTHLTLPTNREV